MEELKKALRRIEHVEKVAHHITHGGTKLVLIELKRQIPEGKIRGVATRFGWLFSPSNAHEGQEKIHMVLPREDENDFIIRALDSEDRGIRGFTISLRSQSISRLNCADN